MDPFEQHIIAKRKNSAASYLNFIGLDRLKAQAEAATAQKKQDVDDATNNVLSVLNAGLTATDQKNYTEANANLSKASDLIEKSKSIVAGIKPGILHLPLFLVTTLDPLAMSKMAGRLAQLDVNMRPPDAYDTKSQNAIAWIIADNSRAREDAKQQDAVLASITLAQHQAVDEVTSQNAAGAISKTMMYVIGGTALLIVVLAVVLKHGHEAKH